MTFCNQFPLLQIIGFHIKMGWYVHWNERYTIFVGQIQIAAGYSGEKEILYHLDYPNKFLWCYYLDVRQHLCQKNEMPFYTALVQPPLVPIKLCEH